MNHTEERLRRLRYRMRRMGMLEIDAWLAALDAPLSKGELIPRIEALLAMDTPELLAMMHGEQPIPEELKPWLDISSPS